MSRFREKLISFMYGRYGVDSLYYALLVLYLVVLVVNLMVRSWVLTLLMTAILVYAMFRSFSRNTYRRAQENAGWLKVWTPVKGWFCLQGNRIRDIKKRRYRRCPQCHATLRLPVKRGKHSVSCPRCGKEFQVHVLF